MKEITTRYQGSVGPIRTDGRDIDPSVGALAGEGASQRAYGAADEHLAAIAPVWHEAAGEQARDATYYERPLLQEPVWRWMIPTYYYVGGLTGACLVMSAAVQVSKFEGREALMKRCRWIGFVGSGASAVLLIADLGRPGRFLNMLRVFRPTSAMNMGAWILSGVGACGTAALWLEGRGGLLKRVGEIFGILAGLFGAGLATYTGVLVGNSAVPVWQQSRRMMPILFGASAMASVGSLFKIIPATSGEQKLMRMFGDVGQVGELVAGAVMERQASEVERVGRPFKEGVSGTMWRTAAVLTACSVLLTALPGKSRTKRVASGLLGSVGSGLMRFSIEQLGKASARDARASFHQQRAGKGAAEVVRQ